MKKLAVILIFAMVFSTFIFHVSAETDGTLEVDGASKTWTEFVAGYAGYSAASVKLTSDVTVASNFATLDAFSGTFDGNGYSINGLRRALFRGLNGATIENLTLNGSIELVSGSTPESGWTAISALSYDASGDVTLKKVVNNADIVITNSNNISAGAFFSYVKNAALTSITMISCVNNGDITVNGSHSSAAKQIMVGGLIGRADIEVTISKCINTGDISANMNAASANVRIGGMIGSGGGNIEQCVNTGKIKSFAHAGGIIGEIRQHSTIKNCYNFGIIEGGGTVNVPAVNDSGAGGILGFIIAGGYNANIVSCVNEGTVNSTKHTGSGAQKNSAGGIVGMTASGSGSLKIIAGINRGSVVSDNIAGGLIGLAEKSTAAENCFVNAEVSGAEGKTGALCGVDTAFTADANTKYVSDTPGAGVVASEADWSGGLAINFIGFQNTTADTATNTIDIRFISTIPADSLSYDKAGYEIIRYTAKATGSTSEIGAVGYSFTEVYENLLGNGEVYDPETFKDNAAFFVPITVTNVPADGTVTFILRPYLVKGGDVTYGTAVTLSFVNGVFIPA